MSNWVAAVGAVLAVIVAVGVFCGQRRESNFELVRSLHADLTTGEVAVAREKLARFRYGPQSQTPPPAQVVGETVTAYFTILWCFERLAAGRETLTKPTNNRVIRNRASVAFFDKLMRWHTEEWHGGLPAIKAQLERAMNDRIYDSDSVQGINRLAYALRIAPFQNM